MRVNIEQLQPTEIALPRGSVGWMDRKHKSSGIDWFKKITVIPFGERYAIVKGNKRTYVFYMNGLRELEVICRNLEPSNARHTGTVNSAEASQEAGIHHIWDLEGRIYNRNKYERVSDL